MDSVKSNSVPLSNIPVKQAPCEIAVPERKTLGEKVADYFEPRATTGADLEYSSPFRAGTSGALQGFFVGGIEGAVGGASGGVVGTRIGEETGSMKNALLAGSIAGAGATLLTASIIPLVMGSPSILSTYILTMGLIGAGAGAAGNAVGIFKDEKHRKELSELINKAIKSENLKADESSEKTKPQVGTEETTEQKGRISFLLNKIVENLQTGGKAVLDKTRKFVITPLKKLIEKNPKLFATLAGAGMGTAAGALGGPVGMGLGALTGGVNGFLGAKMAEKMESVRNGNTKRAISSGIGAGTVLTASTGALMGAAAAATAVGNPAIGVMMLSASLIGALSGTAGTLSGSRLGSVRDGAYGGFITGYLAKAFSGLGGTLTPLSSSIGAAVGARAESTIGKAMLGAVAGGTLGAATGAIGGPIAAAAAGAVGAIAGGIGAAGGPKLQQAVRNLTEDFQKKLSGAADKVTDGLIGVFGRKGGIIAAGVLAGAVGSAPMALMASIVLGPAGLIIPSVVGGAISGYKFSQQFKDMENINKVNKELIEHGPIMVDLKEQMVNMALPGLKEQLKNLPEDVQKMHLDSFQKSCEKELVDAKPIIDKIEQAMSAEIYKSLKKDMKKMKTEEEKEKFLENRISAAKPELARIIVNHLIAVMSNKESQAQQQSQ